MKIFTLSIIVAIFIASNSLYASDKTIKDNSGRITGYMKTENNKTYYVDKNGRRGGYITTNGVIKDKSGRTTGYMKKKGNKIYYTDRNGRRGDYIESDGTIKDKNGRKKGSIK